MTEPKGLRQQGSTLCVCGTSYKNNAVPPICTTEGCGYELGKHKHSKKNSQNPNLTSIITTSVNLNRACRVGCIYLSRVKKQESAKKLHLTQLFLRLDTGEKKWTMGTISKIASKIAQTPL